MSGLSWTLPDSTVTNAPAEDPLGHLLGKDILFTDDLKVSQSGDYITVDGKENLRRAIYRRLLTAEGEFKFRPTYGAGLQQFVKKPFTSANVDSMKQRIFDQLAQETRIEKVEEVTVARELINGVYVIKVYVKARALGRNLKFEPFGFSEEAA